MQCGEHEYDNEDCLGAHMAGDRKYTIGELWSELGRFEEELKTADLRPSTISTYTTRSEIFLRWLTGDYKPTGPR